MKIAFSGRRSLEVPAVILVQSGNMLWQSLLWSMIWYCDHKCASGTDGQCRYDYYALNKHNKYHFYSSIEYYLREDCVCYGTIQRSCFLAPQLSYIWWSEVTWKFPGIFNEHIPDSYEWWCKQGIHRKLLETISKKQIWHPTLKRKLGCWMQCWPRKHVPGLADKSALLLCLPDSSC